MPLYAANIGLAQLPAQGRAGVVAAVQAALLQDGHHETYECVEGGGEIGRQDAPGVAAVASGHGVACHHHAMG